MANVLQDSAGGLYPTAPKAAPGGTQNTPAPGTVPNIGTAFTPNPGGGSTAVPSTPSASAGTPDAPGAPFIGPNGQVTTVTPTSAPPASINTSPGYTPDYNGLIQNDPTYAGAQSAAQAAQASAAAQRRAAAQQAVIQYGGLPPGFTDTYGDIDQATLDQAKANQQSTLAQLQNSYGTSKQQFMRALAARGALQSGDLSYGQDQLDKGYAQQQYDSAGAVGNSLTGALNSYTGVLNTNAQNLSGAIGAAEQNVLGMTDSAGNPIYAPVAAKTASLDTANTAKYGQAIYSDGQGNLYDQYGNPVKPLGAVAGGYAGPGAGSLAGAGAGFGYMGRQG